MVDSLTEQLNNTQEFMLVVHIKVRLCWINLLVSFFNVSLYYYVHGIFQLKLLLISTWFHFKNNVILQTLNLYFHHPIIHTIMNLMIEPINNSSIKCEFYSDCLISYKMSNYFGLSANKLWFN